MVWAAIRYAWRWDLFFIDGTLNVQCYRDHTLLQLMISYVTRNSVETFMHDNAWPHVACICPKCLTEIIVQVMECPPHSPDMNPIENLWDNLELRVPRQVPLSVKVGDFGTAIMEELETIPVPRINVLIASMPRRVKGLVDGNGEHTRCWHLSTVIAFFVSISIGQYDVWFHWYVFNMFRGNNPR